MTKTEMFKYGAGLFTGIGVGKIVGSIAAQVVPQQKGAVQKLMVISGGFVLGAMAAETTNAYLGQKIDQFLVWVNGNKETAE